MSGVLDVCSQLSLCSLMHRALQTGDIVATISQYLQDDPRSLARLARVSKSFHKPSISLLWANVKGWSALERLLWSPKGASRGNVSNINGALAENNLNRLKLYGGLVKTLDVELNLKKKPSQTLWDAVVPDTSMPLLLRLQELSMEVHSDSLLLEAAKLVALPLKRLCVVIKTSVSQAGIEDFVGILPERAQNLEWLELSAFGIDVKPEQFANAVVEDLAHLLGMRLICGSGNGIQLHQLSVHLDNKTSSPIPILPSSTESDIVTRSTLSSLPSSLSSVSFAQLQVLKLSGGGRAIAESIQALKLPTLQGLEIYVDDSFAVMQTFSLDSLRPLLCGISKFSASLRSLTLFLSCDAHDADLLDFPTVFPPLFACKGLNKLCITAPDSLLPGNLGLHAFAQSWPHLGHLELRSTSEHPRARLSLNSLSTLAEHCKSLKTLAVAVNLGGFDARSKCRGKARTLTKLELLTPSVLTNDERAYEAIERLWPNAVLERDSKPHQLLPELESFINKYNTRRLVYGLQGDLARIRKQTARNSS